MVHPLVWQWRRFAAQRSFTGPFCQNSRTCRSTRVPRKNGAQEFWEGNVKSINIIAVLLVLALGPGPAIAMQDAAPDRAATSFADLKQLVGVWRQIDKPQSPLRIRFSLTAGGTVLVEEWLRGDQPHSMTLYHRDGPNLMATHYCPQGNQPRLIASLPVKGDLLQFSFRDATDLDAAQESHLVQLDFAFTGPDRITRAETYRQGGTDESSELRLAREQSSDSQPGR
jgi:hypothetical protein